MTKPKPTADSIAAARERKTAALAVKLTFVQRRVLGAVLDLFDAGSVAVTVSDVFTRLASDLSASPIAEAEIRRQLEGMPDCVTRIRPEIVITDAAWATMRRQPAPVAAREPSTPIAEAVTAQPVPIAPPPVAPVLREPPKTPVRKPTPLSLDTVKVAERPKSDVTILAPAPEVDPEAVKRALAMEARPAVDPGSRNDPAFVAALDEVLEYAGPMLARLKDDAPSTPTDRPAVFPRQEREPLTDLALRYLRARGHEGATAAEAQADTGIDLGTTLCDITRRGRAVGLGNGSRHNGTHAIKDAPRRRWWAAEFAPEGVVPEVKRSAPVKRVVVPETPKFDVVDPAWASSARQAMEEIATLRQVLAPTEEQTLEDRARDLNTQIAAAKFWLDGNLTETVDEAAERVVKSRNEFRRLYNAATDELTAIADALGFTGDARKLIDFARELARDHADLSGAVDHTLHVLASNLPKDTPEIEGGDETTGPLSTGDELMALANAAANALATISEAAPAVERADVADALLQAGDDLVADVRRAVVGDLARALNVQVEHTDAGEAYFWLLDVARKRVPLNVGIDRMIQDELEKHEDRMTALSVVRKLAKAST